MDCAGRAERRRRFGFTRRTVHTRKILHGRRDEAKAVSPLRSATAIHNASGRDLLGYWDFSGAWLLVLGAFPHRSSKIRQDF